MKNPEFTYPEKLLLPWKRRIIQYAEEEFPFLHDTMIASLGGRLFMAWYTCAENEMIGRTVIRGRWSSDGGESWSEPEIVAEDAEERLMVPVIFSEYDGEIWAYVTRMTSPDHPIGYACFRYESGSWVKREERRDPVIFNTMPEKADEKWLIGGRMAEKPDILPQYPIVAHAFPSSPANWEITRLPQEEKLHCPETALLVNGKRVTALTRNDGGDAVVFESGDGGITWEGPFSKPYPIHPAKMCGGSLPDGRQFLIFNERTPQKDRSRLIMALRAGPDAPFDRAYTVFEGYDQTLRAGPYWHYPCAAIHEGRLFISCTSSGDGVRRNAALANIELDQL